MILNKLSKKTAPKLIALLMASVLSINVITNTTQVLAIDETFYSGNDIFFTDPNAGKGIGCESGSVSIEGKDNIEKALSFYMQSGMNLSQAAGIVGNYIAESGVNPAIEQGGRIVDASYTPRNSVGFGIAQWTFTARQAPLVEFVKKEKVSIIDLGGQLKFSLQELKTTHKKAMTSLNEAKAKSDPAYAAYVFHRDFEGSADTEEQVRKNRGGNAEKLYKKYKNNAPLASAPGSGSTTAGDCVPAASGDLAKTTLSYAWPTYRGLTTDAKPEWDAAWKKAKAAGFYVGGIAHPGIDCGGFVTRLLIDSGFEPKYNYSGKGGNTSMQLKWAEANWEKLGPGGSTDAGKLQAGDVALRDGHTYIFVGTIPGFKSKIASASLDERAPMAGKESATDSSFTWYRKK